MLKSRFATAMLAAGMLIAAVSMVIWMTGRRPVGDVSIAWVLVILALGQCYYVFIMWNKK